jgi:hypothetical protein
MTRYLKLTLIIIVIIFALIGAATVSVFVAMQYGMLNVRGSIVERNAFFGQIPKLAPNTVTTGTSTPAADNNNGCRPPLPTDTPCEWYNTVYWDVVKGGLEKDAAIINRVSRETGVPARMIAAAVIPEQTRFFTDNRDTFKRYFEPLKLLGTMTKFSLGVSGIKQDTAKQIELLANSSTSPYYPGDQFAPLLAYNASTTDTDGELYNRLTDSKNHYYSYLYTAAFLQEITAQWKAAGFDVSERPDVLVTLFNLGFGASQPKANPQVAGARITTGGQSYSFGYLGTLFYQSNELSTVFSSSTAAY